MMLSMPGGNALGSWTTEEAARKAIVRLLEQEPEAERDFVVVGF